MVIDPELWSRCVCPRPPGVLFLHLVRDPDLGPTGVFEGDAVPFDELRILLAWGLALSPAGMGGAYAPFWVVAQDQVRPVLD
eukprot:6151950-Pyramimonas_sp.AAC.1